VKARRVKKFGTEIDNRPKVPSYGNCQGLNPNHEPTDQNHEQPRHHEERAERRKISADPR
jgi:hypothetical protein